MVILPTLNFLCQAHSNQSGKGFSLDSEVINLYTHTVNTQKPLCVSCC
jgi:hypothetical protein